MHSARLALLLFPLLWASGCATWDLPTSPSELQLPVPNAGTNAVVFETAFIRWPAEMAEDADPLWKVLDEQCLPLAVRQQLAANGLRVGILSDPLPDAIRETLEATSDLLTVIHDQYAKPGAELLTKRERKTCPSGSREELEVLPLTEGRKVVLVQDLGRVRALTFEQPRGILQATLENLGDGSVQMQIVPTIDYGTPRQRIIGGQNAFKVDVRRDREVLQNLHIQPILRPGQTLVLTATTQKKGIGAFFFADRFESEHDRLLLLLRIVEAGRGDLFTPRRQQESLVTPLP